MKFNLKVGIVFLFMVIHIFAQVKHGGTIVGKVFDEISGEALPGVNIYLKGTQIGCASDIDGNFIIRDVPPGVYNIIFSFIGYKNYIIKNVKVIPDKRYSFIVKMQEQSIKADDVTVQAYISEESDVGSLIKKRNALTFDDVVSSETISRTGSGNAASAAEKITGVTTEAGKYVYIRGIGGRYCTTTLNGIELSSADPDKKAVNFDLFPTDFIENVKAIKTMRPDMSGDFAGGIMDIDSKKFPERFLIKFSTSTKYNSNVYKKGSFLKVADEELTFWGDFNGFKDIPTVIKNIDQFPNIGYAFTDKNYAYELDRITKSLNSPMAPVKSNAPLQNNWSLSLGNQLKVFNREFDFLIGAVYSRDVDTYDDGENGSYILTGNVDNTNQLTMNFRFKDHKSTNTIFWGLLSNMAYNFSPYNQLYFNLMYNQNSSYTARYQYGAYPEDLQSGIYETRTIKFQKRNLFSLSLNGEHLIHKKIRVDWNIAFNNTFQDEPDTRFFSDDYVVRDNDTTYFIHQNLYPYPTHYFRNLKEQVYIYSFNIKVPDVLYDFDLKTGLSVSRKHRCFRERRFELRQDKIRYNGDVNEFFSSENMGILSDASSDNFFRFGNYLTDNTQLGSSYDGDENIDAYYIMFTGKLTKKLSTITGIRFERTLIDVSSFDKSKEKGYLKRFDLLPSLNLLYALNNSINLRFATSRTIARPNMRELSPYASFDFVGDYIFIGNANLDRALIYNYDLRFEKFFSSGEFISLSVFAKSFKKPIEKVILNINGEIQFQNVDNAQNYGLEFEFHKKLDFIDKFFKYFMLTGNLSLINSSVKIPESEYIVIKFIDSKAKRYRPMAGQSPYVINLDLSYDNYNMDLVATLHYYVFGRRLSEISIGGTPDIYEKPFHRLDFVISKKIWKRFNMKFSVKNILKSYKQKVYTYKKREYFYQKYGLGRTYSVGFSYSFN